MSVQATRNSLTHFRYYAHFDANLRKLVDASNKSEKEPPIDYINSSESDKISKLLDREAADTPQHHLILASVRGNHRQAVSLYTEPKAEGGRTSLLVFDSTTGTFDRSKAFSPRAWSDGTMASAVSKPTAKSWAKLMASHKKADAKILTFLLGTQGGAFSCGDHSLFNLEQLQNFTSDLHELHRKHFNNMEEKLKNETPLIKSSSPGVVSRAWSKLVGKVNRININETETTEDFYSIHRYAPHTTQTKNLSPLAEQNPDLLARLLAHSENRPILEGQMEHYKLSDVSVTADGKNLVERFDSIEPPSSSIYNERLARLSVEKTSKRATVV